MDFLEIIGDKREKAYKITFLYVFRNKKAPRKS
jgi:hypothetical protein